MNEQNNDGPTPVATPRDYDYDTLVRIAPAQPTARGYTMFTGLEVIMPNGEPLPGVTRIVLTGEPDSLWHARIDLDCVPPTVDAAAVFAAEGLTVKGAVTSDLPRVSYEPGAIVELRPGERAPTINPPLPDVKRFDPPYTCAPYGLTHETTVITSDATGTLLDVSSLAGCMRVVRTPAKPLDVPGPRITQADFDAAIAEVYYFTAAQGAYKAAIDRVQVLGGVIDAECHKSMNERLMTLTICVILLRDGTAVIGESAPARTENFDFDRGRLAAYNNATAKLWPLFGLLLRQRVAVEG
jgi:hypothetical protein